VGEKWSSEFLDGEYPPQAQSRSKSMERTIGVSLSGGGLRAAAFGLGALIYLKDSGLHRRVSSIASVSGGSLTNAFVGYRSAFRSGDASKFEDEIRPLAQYLSYGGVSFERMLRMLLRFFLGGCAVLILATILFIAGWFGLITIEETLQWYYFLAGFLMGVAYVSVIFAPLWFFRTLNSLYALNLHRNLFESVNVGKRDGLNEILKSLISIPQLPKDAVLLEDLSVDADHILCATDLSTASHFLMAPRFLWSSKYGTSSPCRLPVATAVLASAAFPGVFAPVRLRVSDFLFAKEKMLGIKTITLADGGIHDNLGTPFSITGSRREKSLLTVSSRKPDHLIAVNSSSRDQVYVELPKNAITSRVFGLFRQFAVVHDSNSAARARAVEETFLRALEDNGEYLGTVVSIEESPIEVCEEVLSDDFLNSSRSNQVEALRRRAREMLGVFAAHSMDSTSWDGLRRKNEKVPTTLGGLGPDIVADLMFHGYALTMVKCRLFLGVGNGDVEVPSKAKFEKLCSQPTGRLEPTVLATN
jgi:Patatin-like phospholipase